MRSLCIVELHVSVNIIIPSVAQKLQANLCRR